MATATKKEESTIPQFTLDSKDMAILHLLQKNARITVKEISDKMTSNILWHLMEYVVHVVQNHAMNAYIDHTNVFSSSIYNCTPSRDN